MRGLCVCNDSSEDFVIVNVIKRYDRTRELVYIILTITSWNMQWLGSWNVAVRVYTISSEINS